jgi:hypothetical protein
MLVRVSFRLSDDMDENKIYLVLVNEDFELTDEVAEYFLKQEITVLKYWEQLGILKLESIHDLLMKDIKFIDHIELDSTIKVIDEEE